MRLVGEERLGMGLVPIQRNSQPGSKWCAIGLPVVSAAVEVDTGVVGHIVRDLNQILISPTHTGAMQRLLPVHVVAEGWLCLSHVKLVAFCSEVCGNEVIGGISGADPLRTN